MTSLIKYDSARFALQQAVEIDEVKDIRDKAQAMAAYARQANDTQLVEWATEIKVRAERRAGQMLAEMPKQAGARGTGKKVESHDVTPLSELGISKNQSSRWQKLAAVSDEQFEQAITAAKEVAGEVTTAAMLRIEKANRPKVSPALNLETEEKLSTGNETEEPEYDENEQIILELKDTVVSLDEENTRLKDAIATNQLPEDEIQSAAELIADLRKHVRSLEIELNSTRLMRDKLMNDCDQREKQIAMYLKQLKKAGIK